MCLVVLYKTAYEVERTVNVQRVQYSAKRSATDLIRLSFSSYDTTSTAPLYVVSKYLSSVSGEKAWQQPNQ